MSSQRLARRTVKAESEKLLPHAHTAAPVQCYQRPGLIDGAWTNICLEAALHALGSQLLSTYFPRQMLLRVMTVLT